MELAHLEPTVTHRKQKAFRFNTLSFSSVFLTPVFGLSCNREGLMHDFVTFALANKTQLDFAKWSTHRGLAGNGF